VSPRKRMPELAGLHEWMVRYVDGDPSAFSRLHGRLRPRLRGLLLKLTRDEAAVDDLEQLTLLKGHLARDRFVLQGGDPDGAVQAWYFAIGRNVAMDFLRERYRGERRHAEPGSSGDGVAELPAAEPDPEALGEQVEQEAAIVDRVREAIARLPDGQREVVELHKLRGMSMAEVAERLRVREGAVRVRAHRAYKTLARLLAAKELGPLLSWLLLPWR
jgi:RNA polymerase sigma-70 factor (ECF subfamily)